MLHSKKKKKMNVCCIVPLNVPGKKRRVRLAYQPPTNSTFLSEQTSNQPVLFSQNKPAPAISNQPNEQAEN
jgi:hypothetical protein